MSAFLQPPLPGYSPWAQSRQTTPFLQVPGPQGLQEGAAGGQQLSLTPTQGTPPPSSIPLGGNTGDVFGTGNIASLMQALMGGAR